MERVGVTGTDIPMPHFFEIIFFLFILGTYIKEHFGDVLFHMAFGDVPAVLYTGTGTK